VKKIFLIILIFVANLIYSQNQFGLLPCGMGINVSEDKTVSLDFDLNIGYFSIDGYIFTDRLFYSWSFDPGIGIIWVPVNYRYFSNNHYISIINFQAYWNIFHLIPVENPYDLSWQNSIFIGGSIFGPFVSINYAPNFNFNNYIFCTGIRYNLTGKDHGNRFYIFNIECGYKLFDNKKNYYFGLNIDIVCDTFFILIKINDKKNNKKQNGT
jgi:hypothetical protein